MDKEPKKKKKTPRKIGKCLTRGTFAGRIVTASTPSSMHWLRSLKSPEDGYDADESDFELEEPQESVDPKILHVTRTFKERQKSLPGSLQKKRIQSTPELGKPGLRKNRQSQSKLRRSLAEGFTKFKSFFNR